MITAQTVQGTDIRLPRTQRERLRDHATSGDNIILLLKTATATLIGDGGTSRKERHLDTELRLRLVETGDSITFGSLPDRIIGDIRGGKKGIHQIKEVTAEVIEIRSGNGSGHKDTDISDANQQTQHTDTEIFTSDRDTGGNGTCPNCGTAFTENRDVNFCPKCGFELSS